MFGFVTAYQETLTEEELGRYRGCYCGLCRALGERHGILGKLTLSYDMTFLALMLNSLYEGEEITGAGRCVVHPFKQRAWWKTKYTDYAADLSIALTYHNALDDWKDDRKPIAWTELKLLQTQYEQVKERYPRQCTRMEEELHLLSLLEAQRVAAPDAAAACFGRLMGELFVCDPDDYWAQTLYATGDTLGRFIYLMDACMDLEADQKHDRYNPLIETESASDPKLQTELLTMLIGDCALEFEKLPLLQDVGILRNILHSGVWQKYKLWQKKKNEGEPQDD